MTSPALQEIVAVLASPAAGNPAQYLFERALAAAGLDWQVVTCDVSPDRIAAAITGAGAMGFRGCLLAEPLCRPALGLAATASPAATFVGGAGLLERTPQGFTAHVTDGRATIEAVRSHVDPAGRHVLVLGAGFAGRAVALEMALAGVASIAVADPDPELATTLVGDLRAVSDGPAEVLAWGERIDAAEQVTIVVRSPGVSVPLGGLRSDMLLAVMGAATEPPAEALAAGCCLVGGLEIRALQGAIDFHTLAGLEPDVEMLRDALDEFLS